MDENFKNNVKESFITCKNDILKLRFENSQLKKILKYQEKELEELKDKITQILKYNKENQKINNSEKEKTLIPFEIPKKPLNLQNKKQLIKENILEIIEAKGEFEISKIKKEIVDMKNLCSKATFYNHLKNIESENKILIFKKNSKNLVKLQI